MAFAGSHGAAINLTNVPRDNSVDSEQPDAEAVLLFSESASRFLVEVSPGNSSAFEGFLRAANVPFGYIGEVTTSDRLQIDAATGSSINLPLADLKESWQKPLRW